MIEEIIFKTSKFLYYNIIVPTARISSKGLEITFYYLKYLITDFNRKLGVFFVITINMSRLFLVYLWNDILYPTIIFITEKIIKPTLKAIKYTIVKSYKILKYVILNFSNLIYLLASVIAKNLREKLINLCDQLIAFVTIVTNMIYLLIKYITKDLIIPTSKFFYRGFRKFINILAYLIEKIF